VTLHPRVPSGWHEFGPPVAAGTLKPGQTLAGTWVVRAPAKPAVGYLDIPIVARYWQPGDKDVLENEKTVRVHSWTPLPAGWSYLSDLPFTPVTNGLGPVERDTTNGTEAAGDGRGIAIRRVAYGKGLGMFAAGEVTVPLAGKCTRFVADVGLDDEASLDIARTRMGGTVTFTVTGDGTVLADSGVVNTRTAATPMTVDVTGIQTLTLRLGDAGDGNVNDRGSWADARVFCG
jgi:hypothetical protein